MGDGHECLPIEIKPDKINMTNYDINFDKNENRIKEIRHKELGLVKFISIKIDEDCGYISGSKFIVYTSEHHGFN